MAIPVNKYDWGQWRAFNTSTKKFHGGEAQITCQDIAPGNINTRIFKVTDAQGNVATGTVDVSLKSSESTAEKIGYGDQSGGDTTSGTWLATGLINWMKAARRDGVCGINPERNGAVIVLAMEKDGTDGNGDLIDANQTFVTDGGMVIDSQFSGGVNLLMDHQRQFYDKEDVLAGAIPDITSSYYTGVQDYAGVPIYQHHKISGSFEVQDTRGRKKQYKSFLASSAIKWSEGGWDVELNAVDGNATPFKGRLGRGILYAGGTYYRDGVTSPESCTVLGGGGTIFQVTLIGSPFNESLYSIDTVIAEDPNGGTFGADQNITANCSVTNASGGLCVIDTPGGINNGGSVLIWYTVQYTPLTKPSVIGWDDDYKP